MSVVYYGELPRDLMKREPAVRSLRGAMRDSRGPPDSYGRDREGLALQRASRRRASRGVRAGMCICAALLLGCQTGSASVQPREGIAGEHGTWTVTWTAPAGGRSAGSSVYVQLPNSWFYGERNSLRLLQSTDPTADSYVSAVASVPGVKLATTVLEDYAQEYVKSSRLGLDGRLSRYVLVVQVAVLSGRLDEGDTIQVVFGDTAGGSRGMPAATVSTGPAEVLVAVGQTALRNLRLLPGRPLLHTRPGAPVELLVSGPSTLTADVPAELHIALVDRYANPVALPAAETISLSVVQGEADLPASISIDVGGGWTTASFVPRGTGVLRLEAGFASAGLETRSNPMIVAEEEPALKLYWGDLHSHTHYSHDAVGGSSFDYARYVSGLDFYAMADHSLAPIDGAPRGLGPQLWDEYTALTDTHHAPGSFVTIHGYEASFGSPSGHHNVYFRGEPGPLVEPSSVTLTQLWDLLTAGEALTIPHHTGRISNTFWTVDDPQLRRNVEIYSAHGLSEVDDPDHPLAYENTGFTSPRSARAHDALFMQDAWRQGFELSTIASSDDHTAQPGKPHFGLAAVWASDLQRGDVFDGLYERRTYGTTGERILLDFSVDGVPMGRHVTVTDDPQLRFEVHGTDLVESVEILIATASSTAFEVLHRIEPGTEDVSWEGTGPTPTEASIYYVRVRQASEVRGRISMAWSSPIWVDPP